MNKLSVLVEDDLQFAENILGHLYYLLQRVPPQLLETVLARRLQTVSNQSVDALDKRLHRLAERLLTVNQVLLDVKLLRHCADFI